MTLLDATAHLLDWAKTQGTEDRLLKASIRRMEQRLSVLQLRRANAIRSRRHRAWTFLNAILKRCPACSIEWTFGDFIKVAEIDGYGHLIRFDCSDCEVCAYHFEVGIYKGDRQWVDPVCRGAVKRGRFYILP